MLIWLFRIAILALVGGTVLGIILAEVLLRVSQPPSGGNPGAVGLGFENVELAAADGTPLRGWWLPAESGKGTVLVCHGYGADKADALAFAQILVEGGFDVLAMDFRGHGESSGRTGSLGHLEVPDVRTATDWLFEQGKVPEGRLGIHGYSMGAGIAILAAAGDDRIRAVSADSPFAEGKEVLARFMQLHLPVPRFPIISAALGWAEWRLGCDYGEQAPVRQVSDIAPRPLLLIHGELDDLIPVEHSRRIFDAAGEPKELWIVPKTAHIAAYSKAGEEYRKRLVEFFDRAFADEGTQTGG